MMDDIYHGESAVKKQKLYLGDDSHPVRKRMYLPLLRMIGNSSLLTSSRYSACCRMMKLKLAIDKTHIILSYLISSYLSNLASSYLISSYLIRPRISRKIPLAVLGRRGGWGVWRENVTSNIHILHEQLDISRFIALLLYGVRTDQTC